MSSYWQKRQAQLNSSLEKDEAALKKRLLNAYEKEAAKLDKEIAAYYQKYGRDNVIEYACLFEQLSADDIKLLIERMDDFAKKYPQYANLMPVRESVYKLNRLEGLKESVLLHQYEIGAITNGQLQEHLNELYFTNSKAAAKAVGLKENESILRNFVNTSWTGSKDYSERIWQNAEKLAEYLNSDISQGFARGNSYERLSQQVRSRFINVSKNDAYRLIYTEGTYVMNEAQAKVFEEDFEEYEYLTAGDGKVCSTCSALRGKRFKFSQREPGSNFPPMHPWCRCHFNPVVDDWDKWIDDYEKRHGGTVKPPITKNSNRLTDDEKYAINQYISSFAYIINEKLRRNIPLTLEEENIRINLDSALSKMPSYEGDLTRSLYFANDRDAKKYISTIKQDEIITAREYLSTTYGNVYNSNGQIQIYILNSKSGKDISRYNPDENEVLYQRNSMFKVITTGQIKDKFYIVLEELKNIE